MCREHFSGLPLYEGVDWNCFAAVIRRFSWRSPSLRGSGLKFSGGCQLHLNKRSPSLRGSGLKYTPSRNLFFIYKCLPLYEGVDWNTRTGTENLDYYSLPLYEGVDWNYRPVHQNIPPLASPSLRGSGLKCQSTRQLIQTDEVSLFTREWIEID